MPSFSEWLCCGLYTAGDPTPDFMDARQALHWLGVSQAPNCFLYRERDGVSSLLPHEDMQLPAPFVGEGVSLLKCMLWHLLWQVGGCSCLSSLLSLSKPGHLKHFPVLAFSPENNFMWPQVHRYIRYLHNLLVTNQIVTGSQSWRIVFKQSFGMYVMLALIKLELTLSPNSLFST